MPTRQVSFRFKMVCEKCEKKGKLGKVIDEIISLLENPIHDSNGMVQVITPDPWKAGASNTTKPGGRKVGENKLLTASKNRFNPMTTEFKKCKICKVSYPKSKVSETYITIICFSKKFTRWVLTTARRAPTRRGSVPCAV